MSVPAGEPVQVPSPPKPEKLGRATKDILFGSVAGMISKVFEHPFDLVKVRLQTQPHDTPYYTGAWDCFRKTFVHEGVRGLFRVCAVTDRKGVTMPVLGATMEDAALFLTYNQVQRMLRHARGVDESAALPLVDLAAAAAASGAMAAVVLTPVELIKCRMQVQQMGLMSRAPMPNAVPLIWETVQKSGVTGLWHGLSGTLIREVGGGIAWFLSFELATREFVRRRARARGAHEPMPTKADLGSVELATSGAIAGVSYNVSLFPADSVKSAMQTQRELRAHTREAAGPPLGFLPMLMRIYQTRGIAGLYAGVGVTCLRSAPSSGTYFTLTKALVLYVRQLTTASCTTSWINWLQGPDGRT